MSLASLLLALLLTLPVLSGCGEQEETVLRAVLVGQIRTLDPAMVTESAEKTVVQHLYENLMKLQQGGDGTLTAAGGVARTWQCEDNLDGTETYTFRLRTDARWSDGRTVTAQDFVYGWRHLVAPETGSPNAALLDMVAGYDKARAGDAAALGVRAVDDATLEVALSCHCAYFLRSVCTSPATMPRRADLEDSIANGRHGNGAYLLQQTEGELLTLEASERYYDRRRLGPDRLELTVSLAYDPAAQERPAQLVCGAMQSPEGEEWQAEPYPRTELLLINQMAQQLENKSLRQALSLAVDRTALAELAGAEAHTPAQGLIPDGVLTSGGADFRTAEGALISNEDYEADCEAARDLLRQSGVTAADMADVAILYNANGTDSAVAEAIRTMWQRELGLEVKLRGVSAAEMETALAQGEFSVALWHRVGDRNDAVAFLDMWRSGSEQNVALFHSGAFDMLLRAAAASSSLEARDAYLADAEGLLLEQGNAIPLYNTHRLCRADGNLAGVVSDRMGAYCFHSVTVVPA